MYDKYSHSSCATKGVEYNTWAAGIFMGVVFGLFVFALLMYVIGNAYCDIQQKRQTRNNVTTCGNNVFHKIIIPGEVEMV
jgi:uncharacterized membrane protein